MLIMSCTPATVKQSWPFHNTDRLSLIGGQKAGNYQLGGRLYQRHIAIPTSVTMPTGISTGRAAWRKVAARLRATEATSTENARLTMLVARERRPNITRGSTAGSRRQSAAWPAACPRSDCRSAGG